MRPFHLPFAAILGTTFLAVLSTTCTGIQTATGAAGAAGHKSQPARAPVARAPVAHPNYSPGAPGTVLGGEGSSLVPPTSPTVEPYTSNCMALVDAGFTGRCVVASGPGGTVAGVVEIETGTAAPTLPGPASHTAQERDLVWQRLGSRWSLALRRAVPASSQPTQVWSAVLVPSGRPQLVFVTGSSVPGYGYELDVVSEGAQVALCRFLGQGFAFNPTSGGIVTYVPGWAEQGGPAGAYDQMLIGEEDGAWTVFAEQHVPNKAARAQHHGLFTSSEATPAS